MPALDITFYGVRGSLASPGTETNIVGGNTSCVEVMAGDTRIVLDAGTGLRNLGNRLVAEGHSDTTFLLSHLHWDHIQGLPFFVPLYAPGHSVSIYSGPNGHMPLAQALRRQMCPPFFPVAFDEVAHKVSAHDLGPSEAFEVGDAVIRTARLNHPDPVYGYRIERGGSSLVYATDTEHYSWVDPNLRALAAGADVLIYDAQYTPSEYRGDTGGAKVGWGHSTYEAAVALAREAGVDKLVLFHHDPGRSDAEVQTIEREAQLLFPHTVAAREGHTLRLGGAKEEIPRDDAVARAA